MSNGSKSDTALFNAANIIRSYGFECHDRHKSHNFYQTLGNDRHECHSMKSCPDLRRSPWIILPSLVLRLVKPAFSSDP